MKININRLKIWQELEFDFSNPHLRRVLVDFLDNEDKYLKTMQSISNVILDLNEVEVNEILCDFIYYNMDYKDKCEFINFFGK